jgi:hypothetical protein
MIKLATYAAFIVALVASGAAPASAQVPGNQPIVGISLESSIPIVAKIAGIDPNGGTETLTLANATTETRKVGSVVNLQGLRVGDEVNVTYKERLTFVASEPNAKTPPGQEIVAVAAMEHPQWTIGAAEAQDIRNFYVVAVDPAAKTISLVNPNGGAVHTFTVSDAVAQAQLPRVKAGYKLTIIDLQAVIGAIEKKA